MLKIPLTETQKAIVIGTLLGDGGIYEGSYYIKQSNEHKEYLFWLYNELKNICSSSPTQRKDN